jgi:hypothetical protein
MSSTGISMNSLAIIIKDSPGYFFDGSGKIPAPRILFKLGYGL